MKIHRSIARIHPLGLMSLVAAILALSAVGSGCSLSDPNDRLLRIGISVPAASKSSASSLQVGDVFQYGTPNPLDVYPEKISDFTCFGINVTGPGIQTDPRIGCSSPTIGRIGGLALVKGGTVEMIIPMGIQRKVDLFGLKSSVGCPSVDTILDQEAEHRRKNPPGSSPESQDHGPEGLGEPYLIGSTVTDVAGDTTITIKAKLDPSSQKKVFAGCDDGRRHNPVPGSEGSGGTGGGSTGGAVFSPYSVGGMVVWLEGIQLSRLVASGALISTWDDLSGGGHSATSSSSFRPTLNGNSVNGRPAVHFGGGQYMTISGGSFLDHGKQTILMVAMATSVNQYFLNESFQSGAGFYSNNLLEIFLDHYNYFTSSVRDSAGIAKLSATPGPVAGSFHVYASVWRNNVMNGHSITSVVDGVYQNQANGANADPVTLNSILIGAATTTPTFGLIGDIAEMMIFNREIGDWERDRLECYLGFKYGIAITGHGCGF